MTCENPSHPLQKTVAGELPCAICTTAKEIEHGGEKFEKVFHSGKLEWTCYVHPKPESAE